MTIFINIQSSLLGFGVNIFMIELVSTNHVAMLITVVLQLNNSASNSVCLNEFHVVPVQH